MTDLELLKKAREYWKTWGGAKGKLWRKRNGGCCCALGALRAAEVGVEPGQWLNDEIDEVMGTGDDANKDLYGRYGHIRVPETLQAVVVEAEPDLARRVGKFDSRQVVFVFNDSEPAHRVEEIFSAAIEALEDEG